MRHRKAHRKLGGFKPAHQRAMYSNMLMALVEHGRIKTTEHKARALRSQAEKLVTRATRLGDILLKDPKKLDKDEAAAKVHAIRMVKRTMRDRASVLHLFDEIAPRYLGRPGGYTRLIKLGFRKGDNASMMLVEFVDAEMPEREGRDTPTTKEPEKKKGLLGRLRG